MTWPIGQPQVDKLLADLKLERVDSSGDHARHLLSQAQGHLRSAHAISSTDPAGAYQLGWDAARKAMVAVLAAQGLRPTHKGGHVAVVNAFSAQIGDSARPLTRTIGRMRRRRNESEYPNPDAPTVSEREVLEVLPAVADLITKVSGLIAAVDQY